MRDLVQPSQEVLMSGLTAGALTLLVLSMIFRPEIDQYAQHFLILSLSRHSCRRRCRKCRSPS